MIDQIACAIKNGEDFLVASHINPEGDAIGSTLAMTHALRGMNKKVVAYNKDPLPYNLRFLPGSDQILRELPSGFSPGTAIILDCGNLDRMGKAKKLLDGIEVINIDHHATNPLFGTLNWVLAEASSTGEMLVPILKKIGARFTPEISSCIYTAILTDTGCFKFSNTSSEVLRVAGEMIELGADPAVIAHHLFDSQTAGNLKLLGMVLNTLQVELGDSYASAHVTKEMFRSTQTDHDATEGFVDYLRSIEGVEVAALFREEDERKVKVSLRSKGEVDVLKIAEGLGGGGHKAAAGCLLEGNIKEGKKQVFEKVRTTI